MTICALTHLVHSGFFVIEFATPFNPPPKEGGNIPWSIPHDLFINLEVEKNHLQSLSSSLIRLSQSIKKHFIGQRPFTPFWKEIYFAEQHAFPPSLEGELKGVGESYTTYIQKHENVMPLIK